MGNAIILRLWVQIRKVSVFRTTKVSSLFDTSIWDNKSVQFIEVSSNQGHACILSLSYIQK